LRDSLSRSSQRVCDLFRAWDEDKSGTIDKREFTRAIRALGFVVSDEDAGKVFDALDEDKSGSLEYKELNTMLRKGEGAEAVKARLKRGSPQNDYLVDSMTPKAPGFATDPLIAHPMACAVRRNCVRRRAPRGMPRTISGRESGEPGRAVALRSLVIPIRL
jgi:hypothetical protein